MFSKNVFKETLKANWKLWAAITFVLSLFMFVICVVVGGGTSTPLSDVGVSIDSSSLMSLLSMGFFGMIGFILPLVYVIAAGNNMIASQVDKGSMAYTLSTPTSRKEVTITKIIYFVLSIILMYFIVFLVSLVGFAIAGISYPFEEMLLLFLGIILLELAIAGIVFMFSCIFNTSGKSITFGAGLPILFFIFNVLGEYSSQYDFFKVFKYLSLNSLYSTTDIMALTYSSIIPCFVALAVISIATFMVGHFVFKKKDLPL